MLSRIRQFLSLGQAIWLDYISRELLDSGGLRNLVEEGLTGVTSNPTIFQKSISAGAQYDDDIRRLANEGRDGPQIFEALAVSDVRRACDELRLVYNETHARDGFASIEVNPHLAHDTTATIAEGRRLWRSVDRPNLMIKVPATEEGMAAITALISEGINVNVTLIFGLEMYERVMQAYIDGVQSLEKSRRPPGLVSSVASFFVSRVDTLVDGMLQKRIDAGEEHLEPLLGKAAVANAKIAYSKFKEVFEGKGFDALRAAGARVQRPLWASTSTKNPKYPGLKYVDPLIGPHTVNTVPPQTLDLIRESASPAQTIEQDLSGAHDALRQLAEAGIDMKQVTDQLLRDGVKSFAESFDQLMKDIEKKRQTLKAA